MAKRSKNREKQREKVEIVLLLIEGASDEDALYIPISNMFERISERINVYPIFIHDSRSDSRDITSKYGVKPDNIERLISELAVEPFLRNSGLYPKHIKRIIQFVDLDGAYISDADIIQQEDKNISDIIYLDKIIAPNVECIIDRNKRKRANLDYLTQLDSIKIGSKMIDYSVFYFSSNLDHVLHNNANMPASMKRQAALDFQMFNSELNQFCDFFTSNNLVCSTDKYEESWQVIKEGKKSLSRVTNIHILLNELRDSIGDN